MAIEKEFDIEISMKTSKAPKRCAGFERLIDEKT